MQPIGHDHTNDGVFGPEMWTPWGQSLIDKGANFNLEKLDSGEGDAFFKLGEHQFLAIFEVDKVQPANMRHFGIMVRDEEQIAEVRKKITGKYKLKLEPPFRCDFHDPWGNRIQVVDLHDESLVWMLPYREVQKAGIKFTD